MKCMEFKAEDQLEDQEHGDILIHVYINFCGVLQTCLSLLYFWIIKITLNYDVRVATL